jgi:type III pantothenate kinase
MLLTIDAGNTQTVVGLFRGHDLVDHWRIATVADRTSDELALMVQQFLGFHGFSFAAPKLDEGELAPLERQSITGVAICSGVPRVTAGVRTGMPILYDNPKEVGPDRIANAVGAYDLFGGPTIIVDFGTATTIEAVSAAGEYLGGAIFPGVEIAMDALFGRAAGLRRVELQPPKHVIGKSTAESIQSGTIYGFSAQVDGLVDRFVAELGECTVVSTGGLADLISPHARTVQHYEPWLTLYGLRIIFERNS